MPDVAFYTSAELFELEKQAVLLPSWHMVCRVEDVERSSKRTTGSSKDDTAACGPDGPACYTSGEEVVLQFDRWVISRMAEHPGIALRDAATA